MKSKQEKKNSNFLCFSGGPPSTIYDYGPAVRDYEAIEYLRQSIQRASLERNQSKAQRKSLSGVPSDNRKARTLSWISKLGNLKKSSNSDKGSARASDSDSGFYAKSQESPYINYHEHVMPVPTEEVIQKMVKDYVDKVYAPLPRPTSQQVCADSSLPPIFARPRRASEAIYQNQAQVNQYSKLRTSYRNYAPQPPIPKRSYQFRQSQRSVNFRPDATVYRQEHMTPEKKIYNVDVDPNSVMVRSNSWSPLNNATMVSSFVPFLPCGHKCLCCERESYMTRDFDQNDIIEEDEDQLTSISANVYSKQKSSKFSAAI
ncbi:hypothetical protein Ciccas_004119 [Cichlidogyrus casuarinus]|uniref:Uncharacterized protein n=1 Tax=Cichlidogyrus casuarinus TaxID=1844966 RepID=A0ABD2QCG4_9PLAT